MPMRSRAVVLSLVLVLALSGCGMTAQESAAKPETGGAKTVQLRDGRVVDCVEDIGVDCDWGSPRKLGDGEKPSRQATYYKLKDGRIIPCYVFDGGKYSGGLSCDFAQ